MESSEKKSASSNCIIDNKLFQFFNNGGMVREGWVVVFDDPELNKMLDNGIIFPTETQAKAFVVDSVATPFVTRKVKVGLGIPNETLDEMRAKAHEALKEE